MKIEHLDIKVTDATRVAPHEVACRISLVSGETFDLNSAYRNVMKKNNHSKLYVKTRRVSKLHLSLAEK